MQWNRKSYIQKRVLVCVQLFPSPIIGADQALSAPNQCGNELDCEARV
jgi:hypothetical protein